MFKNSSIDLKHLAKEVLELRYKYIEKIRTENIILCREERKRILEEVNHYYEQCKVL